MSYNLPDPSLEQSEIINSVSEGFNVIVDSVAGSGKTTTILHIGKILDTKNILVLTYNSRLKIETRVKVSLLGLSNMEVHSYHAFGVKYYNSKCNTDLGIIDVITKQLKVKKEFHYDLVILDEQQDITSLYYEFVKKILIDVNNPSIQIVLFGDIYQNIYSFKGSDDRYLTFADKIYVECTNREFRHHKIQESFRITNQMANFINKHTMGFNRISSKKKRELDKNITYLLCDTFSNSPFEEFIKYIDLGFKAEDIFIIAPTIKKGKNDSPIRILENKIVKRGIPCYVPISDEEKLDDEIVRGKVVFSTFHQVKGLERPVVLVFNFDNSYFDYYGRDLPRNICPNILYVALTRAKEYISLFHHYENGYLDFLKDRYNLIKSTRFIEKKSCLNIKKNKPEPIEVSVTELLRNLGIEIVNYVMNFVNYKKIRNSSNVINIPLKVETSKNTYESTCDINGIAIPAMYEYTTKKTISFLDILNSKIKKIESMKNHTKRYIDILENQKISISDMLYLANIYNSVTSGYIFKINQIQNYNWLNKEIVKKCLTRLEDTIQISKDDETIFENIIESNQIIYNRKIVGVLDIVNIGENINVWELKCTQNITNEHILQLVIYSWILEKNEPKKNRKYNLFNIYTNELIEVLYDTRVEFIVEYLVKAKYSCLTRQSDEKFLERTKVNPYKDLIHKETKVECLIDD